jgi:hypothetical protein
MLGGVGAGALAVACGTAYGESTRAAADAAIDGGPPSFEAGADGAQPADGGVDASAGDLDNAIELNGIEQHATLATRSYAGAAGFTIETWFRLSAVPTEPGVGRTAAIVAMADGAPCEETYLGFGGELVSGRKLSFTVDGPGDCTQRDADPLSYEPPTGWEKGVWYHVAAVRQANSAVVLYVNGVPAVQKLFSLPVLARARPTYVGRFTKGFKDEAFFAGAIDELRLYARPLEAGEVSFHYGAGKGTYGAPEPGLLLGFHFDEPSGVSAAPYAGSDRAKMTPGVAWVPGKVRRP